MVLITWLQNLYHTLAYFSFSIVSLFFSSVIFSSASLSCNTISISPIILMFPLLKSIVVQHLSFYVLTPTYVLLIIYEIILGHVHSYKWKWYSLFTWSRIILITFNELLTSNPFLIKYQCLLSFLFDVFLNWCYFLF